MNLGYGVNVRLDPHTKARLDRLAEQSGVKSAVLIRQALDEYMSNVEKTGKISFHVGQVAEGGSVYQAKEQNISSSVKNVSKGQKKAVKKTPKKRGGK